jgi:hypothetical protein
MEEEQMNTGYWTLCFKGDGEPGHKLPQPEVAHSWNPSTWEAKAGESPVGSQPGQFSKMLSQK